jgi:excisionase family DNA binding protein
VDHADQTVTSETANADATPSPATADQDKPGHTAVAHPPTESGFVWMTAAEAARYVGVTPRTIRNWITGRTGGIETFGDNGRSYRFSQAELDAKKAVRSAENNPKK